MCGCARRLFHLNVSPRWLPESATRWPVNLADMVAERLELSRPGYQIRVSYILESAGRSPLKYWTRYSEEFLKNSSPHRLRGNMVDSVTVNDASPTEWKIPGVSCRLAFSYRLNCRLVLTTG